MERKTKINERQKLVLKEVINRYTTKNNSVSSLALSKDSEMLKVWSSATIRNDMAVLEKKGYLKKEYFSSGKVPTKLGYKFYIESLMDEFKKFEFDGFEDTKKKLMYIFSKRNENIEQTIDMCATFVSNFLNLPIVLIKNKNLEKELLKKIDLVSIDDEKHLLYIITSSGEIYKDLIVIDDKKGQKKNDMVITIKLLNEKLFNCVISQISNKLHETLDAIKNSVSQFEFIYENLISRIIFNKLLKNSRSFRKVYNTSSLISRDDIDLSRLMKLLNEYSIFENINFKYLKTGETFFNFETSEDFTVATTNIKSSDLTTHKLSIVGPIRMNYPLIKYILDFLNEKLSNN